MPGHVGKNLAAKVRHVLAQSQLAVDVDVVDDNVAAVLIFHALGSRLEFVAVVFGPPVPEVSFRVVLAAFVIEAMGQFMPNCAASVSVIRSVVHLDVVEGRLQHARGEINVVHLRIVIGVHGRRWNFPLAVIDGLSDFADLAMAFERRSALDVAGKIVAGQFYRAVVAPFIGIADLVANAMQF